MSRPEVWLRGPVADVAPLLQPVAHSLMQSAEEVHDALVLVGDDALWMRTGRSASAGFHVLHAIGSLDRLFTYARGESLSDAQRAALALEPDAAVHRVTAAELANAFAAAIEGALAQVRATRAEDAMQARQVGRAGLPSTVLGLLFHGAEHTLRHVGQMTTALKARG